LGVSRLSLALASAHCERRAELRHRVLWDLHDPAVRLNEVERRVDRERRQHDEECMAWLRERFLDQRGSAGESSMFEV
jgi:hypothetical protein